MRIYNRFKGADGFEAYITEGRYHAYKAVSMCGGNIVGSMETSCLQVAETACKQHVGVKCENIFDD